MHILNFAVFFYHVVIFSSSEERVSNNYNRSLSAENAYSYFLQLPPEKNLIHMKGPEEVRSAGALVPQNRPIRGEKGPGPSRTYRTDK